MTQSTRDAILALRKDKQAMDVFETAESDDAAASAPARLSSSQAYTALSHARSDKKKSEDVVQLDLKPSLAFARFAGRIYDSAVDGAAAASSASPAPSALAKVVPLPFTRGDAPSSYNTSASLSSAFEAPVDKFNRLKREIGQFSTDLALIAASSPPQDDVGELAALLARELKGLDEELTAAVKSAGAGAALVVGEEANGGGDGKATLLSLIIAKLQSATQPNATITITAAPASSSPAPSGDSSVQQQLHVLSSLDRRVAALEKAVGLPVGVLSSPNPSSSAGGSKFKSRSSLTSGAPSSSAAGSLVHSSYSSPYPDLYTAIMALHRKLLLLDPVRLDSLHRNIKTITADLELIHPSSSAQSAQSASPAPAPLPDAARSAEMYDVLMRWDGWVGQLPVIVARLRGLRGVVEEAKGLSERVKKLEAESDAMRRTLDDDREALTRLSTTLPANLQQMDANVQSMQQRIAALQQKIDRLK